MQVKHLVSQLDLNKEKNPLSYGQFDISQFEDRLQNDGENAWQKRGEQKALELFHQAAERVPAYKHFLKKHKIDHTSIKTIDDFKKVPITDKKNYINVYPLKDRCWDGRLTDSTIIAASSGTNGEPTFWPRTSYQELEAGVTHELIFKYLFRLEKYKTLMLICFPMGIYISGMATVLPSWLISTKKYNITCVTVGNNKSEALRVIKKLQEEFEQIVLVGHPFFVKDVIETGRHEGINWSKRILRLMFCSGSFNETWRRYVMNKADIKTEHRVISTYGTSEMLLVGHETPLSIYSHRMMEKNKELRTILHKPEVVPNLFQYNPLLRYIETVSNELIFTSASGIPLIRFNLHDEGEVISFKNLTAKLEKIDPDWRKNLKVESSEFPIWDLPFVTLYGRTDYTVKYYAALIYPEHIQIALNKAYFLNKITGKFVMTKGYLKNMDEYLEINIELRPDTVVPANLAERLQNQIVQKLKQINKEYADTAKHHPSKDLRPRVILWPYQDEKYFKAGLKPKYINNN